MGNQACYWVGARLYATARRRLAAAADDDARIAALRTLCLFNRVNALSTIAHAGRGWLGASFSCAEILTALYFDTAEGAGTRRPDRDYILLSKGHAAAMQYAALAGLGVLRVADLRHYKQPGGPAAHPDRATPGIEANSGSLGQTLSKAAGLALGGARRVFVVLGDGELQEGQNLEAFMTLHRHGLSQVVAIVDCNGIQTDSAVADIKPIPDLAGVLRGLGCSVQRVPGHDMEALVRALRAPPAAGKPRVLLADTRKAAGIPFMEASSCARRAFAWHGALPDDDAYRAALAALADAPDAGPAAAGIRAFLRAHGGNRPATGRPARRDAPVATGAAFGAHLADAAHRDARLVVLGADLEKACGLTRFAAEHPGRYIEMGIAEQDMVSCAGGLALRGLVPVAATFAAFFRRAFEQVYVNATEGTRVIYAGHYAGLCYGPDGKTHQCTGDVAMMRSIPGMRVFYPAFPEEARMILDACLAGPAEGPVYVRLHRTPADPAFALKPPAAFEAGHGHWLRPCSGTGLCLLTSGPHMAAFCAGAADRLAARGRTVDVCAVSTLRGLAPGFVADLARYETLAVAEELAGAGGLHDEVTAALAARGLRLPRMLHRAAEGLTFSTLEPFGLYRHFGLMPEQLAAWLNSAG